MVRVWLGCVFYTAPGAPATVDRRAWTAQIASRGARGGAGVWAHGLGGFVMRRLGVGPGAGRWVFSDRGVLGSLPCVGCRAFF
jgi:hypothetical protein